MIPRPVRGDGIIVHLRLLPGLVENYQALVEAFAAAGRGSRWLEYLTRYLRMGWMSRRTQDTVVQLGRAGYAARGVPV